MAKATKKESVVKVKREGSGKGDQHFVLNRDHVEFCVNYVKHGMNAADAYLHTFVIGKGKPKDSWKRGSLYTVASKLMSRPAIQEYIDELRDEVKDAAIVTAVEHIEELRKLRDSSVGAGKYGPAVTAETNVGKVAGLYVDRYINESPQTPANVSPETVQALVEMLTD